jgi:raffinose/stachyose/melibiose transport system substrate-binding protein
MRSIRLGTALLAAMAIVLASACAGDDDDDGSNATQDPNGPVTLTWWHNGNTDPLEGAWEQVARDFEAANPDVTIKVVPMQNEQFDTKVPLALQGDNPPDVYQQWGGGEEATQVESGKLMDLTEAVSGWIDEIGTPAEGWQFEGKQYGIPYSLHIVGFWYRKDLFDKAGISDAPKTIDELNAAVAKLKDAGIVPISIGTKDRWPAAFWWDYFVLRECSTDTVKQAMKDVDLSDPCFVKAGEDLQAFLETDPFQPGFEGTPAQQGAGSSAGMLANGKAAMELQGTWNPNVMTALTEDKDFKSKLGWFPFPALDGGGGDPNSALGGGDGFSCTTGATSVCPRFLENIVAPKAQKLLVSSGSIALPVNAEAASAIDDPSVKVVQDYKEQASYIQTYFDVALPTADGQALNDAIANFVLGKGSPEDIPKSVGG